MRKIEEKLLGGDVDIVLVDKFDEQIFELGLKKKRVISAFAKWFISLPEDEKRHFVSQLDEQENFTELIERIVNKRVHETFEAFIAIEYPTSARNRKSKNEKTKDE